MGQKFVRLRGRTQIDSFTQNVQWTFGGGGGKRTGRFQNVCFIDISSEQFLQETLFFSFRLLYILLVRRDFYSSESILSVFVKSGHGKHVADADDFTIT